MQIYKNEVKLLDDFKKYVNRKGKKKQVKNNFKSKKQSKKKIDRKDKQEKNNFKSEKTENEIISEIITSIDSRLQIFDEYELQSPKYSPESPIYIPQSPSTQSKTK
ncbi:10782_t:CDS:1 [Cetraspora pellucida]|uniref:10782_t:CDS:1 n=1 Tax=Cetraspora pellucida TaxID=1433469 RepID=A0A9N9CRP0_9GLOM|nr:10782_t:CDS:1 [Cetraspora pellucida]